MPKYEALQPIEHDGTRVEQGNTLTLTEAQAAPLLAIGHVRPVAERVEPKPEAKK